MLFKRFQFSDLEIEQNFFKQKHGLKLKIKTETTGIVTGTNLRNRAVFKNLGIMQRLCFLQKLGLCTSQFLYLDNLVYADSLDDLTNKKSVLGKQQALKDLALINTYRSKRHSQNMPVRGQRTHTNAKTRRKRRVL